MREREKGERKGISYAGERERALLYSLETNTYSFPGSAGRMDASARASRGISPTSVPREYMRECVCVYIVVGVKGLVTL